MATRSGDIFERGKEGGEEEQGWVRPRNLILWLSGQMENVPLSLFSILAFFFFLSAVEQVIIGIYSVF